MPDATERFLEPWHRFESGRDPALLEPRLADDVTLGAPPDWSPRAGRERVQQLLGPIVHAIEDFTDHRQWRDGGSLTGHVGEQRLQGNDPISPHSEGVMRRLDVSMRPRGAIEALERSIAPRMQASLEERLRTPAPR